MSQDTTTSRRRSMTALTFAVAALTAAACTGSEEAFPTEPPVTAATTTQSPASTSTTDLPSTTTESSTTTTSTTTTLPPVTTIETDTPEEAVEQVILSVEERYKRCLDSLPDCDLEMTVTDMAGSFRDNAVSFLTEWKDEGYEVVNVEERTLQIESVVFDERGAFARLCVVDGTIVVRPELADAPRQVIDDTYLSAKTLYFLERAGDGWVISGSERTEVLTGRGNVLCE